MKATITLVAVTTMLLACNPQPKQEKNTDYTIAHRKGILTESYRSSHANSTSVKADLNTTDLNKNSFNGDNFDFQPDLTSKQTFSIDVNADTVLTAKNGTVLKIKPGTFVTADWGRPITGKVDVKISEYYEMSDMLFAKLSTTSDNQLLETGGMVYISATANGKQCKVKDDKTIEIGFPTTNKKPDMQLFEGNINRYGKLNWKLVKKKVANAEKITAKYSPPLFSNGEKGLVDYIDTTVNHPRIPYFKSKFSRVYMTFLVREDGKVSNAEVIHGLEPEVDSAVLNMITKMPDWVPATKNGENVCSRIEMPVYFGLDRLRRTTPYRVFEAPPSGIVEKKKDVGDPNLYVFESPVIGWMNCDRFYGQPNVNTILVVDPGNVQHVEIQLVFHSMRSIMRATFKNGLFYFGRLPQNEKVTLIAFGHKDGKDKMEIITTTAVNGVLKLSFKENLDKVKLQKKIDNLGEELVAWN